MRKTNFVVEYNPEPFHYIFGNWPYTEKLFDRIETLADTEDGLPEGDVSPLFEYYVWRVDQHEVFYRLDGLTIIISMIRPLE